MISLSKPSNTARKQHLWKTIDLGHHSLRWAERLYPQSSRTLDHSLPNIGENTDYQPKTNTALSLERLSWCELELLKSASNLGQSRLGRKLHFSEWEAVDQLASSPFLGTLNLINKRDSGFWMQTPQGESTPSTLFSNWLNESLTPEKTLGEAQPQINHSLLWLSSASYLPHLSSLIYRCFSELPYTHGAYLNHPVALLIGLSDPYKTKPQSGVWGVLDVGNSQASWQLIEVEQSHVPLHLNYKVLQSYGRSFVGERALRRSLLNDHLLRGAYTWSELNPQLRQEWLDYVSLQADSLIKQAWPKAYLTPIEQQQIYSSVKIGQEERQVFNEFQQACFEAIMSWIKYSLKQTNMGPEALRGIYVTGKQSLALMPLLRKAMRVVNVKVAPFGIEHIGAHRYIDRVLYQEDQGYHIENVSPYALILRDDYEGLSKEIFSEQTSVPCIREIDLGESQGELSLWLSNYGELEQKIAYLPKCTQKSRLQVVYETPQHFDLSWLQSDQTSDIQPQWVKV